MTEPLLSVKNLTVEFKLRKGIIRAVDNVSLDICRGKITAIVGESGSGKTTLASTFLNYVSSPGSIASGSLLFEGTDLAKCPENKMNDYRWKEISMVFQAAQNALNPVMTVEQHFVETYTRHYPKEKKKTIVERSHKLLESVKLDPARVLQSYPHEMSGGMKQRVMIAFSLLLSPKLVVLDEPTTALDVITQEYIFEILDGLHRDLGITMVLLTHDIAVVAKVADVIGVMYAGKLVEYGGIYQVFQNPRHPYTQSLIAAAPSLLDGYGQKAGVSGATPDLFQMPRGCPFIARCPVKTAQCENEKPELGDCGEGHMAACHLCKGGGQNA